MAFNNNQETLQLPKTGNKQQKLKGSFQSVSKGDHWQETCQDCNLYFGVSMSCSFMLLSNKLSKTNKLFCFALISGKFVCPSDYKRLLLIFFPGYDAACEEGPGLFAHILTFFSLVLIFVTLPISLIWVVKVVQVYFVFSCYFSSFN